MRRTASIGLLALLLYNMFGLSLAVLYFEKDYQIAASDGPYEEKVMKMHLPSLPYAENLEFDEKLEGLIRQDGQFYNATRILHENDTLYVTLQTNEAARDHFFELANAAQVLNEPHADIPKSPYGKAMELLGSLLKIYIPNTGKFAFFFQDNSGKTVTKGCNSYKEACYLPFQIALASPPPERRQA